MRIPNPEDIYRIRVVLPPEKYGKGEGLYEWRYLSEKFFVDVIDVKKEIERLLPGQGERVLDRLQNFHKVFINTATGEVST